MKKKLEYKKTNTDHVFIVSALLTLHSQALLLESKGHTHCPFTTLELIDCKMDLWSLGRLGQALHLSSLHVLVLDYCR